MSHEIVDHTSELTLRLQAPTLAVLLAEATQAFLELVPQDRIGATVDEIHVLRIAGGDPVALLVAWLNELVFLGEVELWLPTSLDVREDDLGVEVHARGRRLLEPFVLVKAATLHEAFVSPVGHGLEAEVTLDV